MTINYIIPTTTKTQKATAKYIQACAKKLLIPGAYDSRLYVKYCYLKNNRLYMTDAKMLVEFDLQFEAPKEGYFALVTIGKDLMLIDQNLDHEFPETEDLLKVEVEVPFVEFQMEDSFITKYCKILHAMSTPEDVGCFDIEYFKLIPDTAQIYSSEFAHSKSANKAPLVFKAENFRAVIMPMLIK